MTNSSPPESPNPIPERRRRPATGVTFDEMIAIIVAFSTIGAILFWVLGGKNSKLAGNLGLNGNSGLLTLNQTTDTGADSNLSEQELEAENRRLVAQIKEQDTPVVYVPPNQTVQLPAKATRETISLESGAKLVPLTGLATVPALRNRPRNIPPVETEDNNIAAQPQRNIPATEKPKPKVAPKNKPVQKPVAVAPATNMPQDVAPDYWAYSFIKQMRDKKLVPELAENQEFNPDVLITRASMATFVSQAFEEQPATENVKQFNDVSNKNEIAQDIDQAVRTGFMQGYSDNEFKPLENISRYQVLVTLATGLGLQPSKDADQILQQFGDRSKLPDWAKQQVAAATEAGLVVNPPGVDKGSLAPQRAATRAEVVAMIHQALVETGKLEPIESEYIVKP
jgi:S-layer homology domain